MRIAVQRESGEDRKRRAAAVALDLAADRIAADRVRDLDIDQVRGVQCLAVLEQPVLDGLRTPRTQQHLDQGRGIDDDHSRSRSVRITSAGDGDSVTGGCLCKRARNSSIVGRSAT